MRTLSKVFIPVCGGSVPEYQVIEWRAGVVLKASLDNLQHRRISVGGKDELNQLFDNHDI